MSVTLHPSHSLGFKRPLTQVVKRSLTISNPNDQAVAFKVKTTAPKLYCVRPNSGRIEAGENVDISVMLQALPNEPPLSEKCKDKFLIQSTLITPEKETMSLQALWASPDTNEEGKVHPQKLRVTYLPADGASPVESEPDHESAGAAADRATIFIPQNGMSERSEHSELHTQATLRPPPLFSDDFDRENSKESIADGVDFVNAPQHLAASPPRSFAPELTLEAPRSPPPPLSVPARELQSRINLSSHPSQTSRAISPAAIASENRSELEAELRVARAEIERLRATIATISSAPQSEMRYRLRATSDVTSVTDTDVTTVVEDPQYRQPEGVPLQVVVIVALGVFITTYLFF